MCLGIPGKVLEVTDVSLRLASVNVSGARRTVDISVVDEEGIAPGDWVLVHAGFALSKISETEALEILALLREMSDAYLAGMSDVAEPSPATSRGGASDG